MTSSSNIISPIKWAPTRNDLVIYPLEVDYTTIDESWNAQNVCSSFWRLYMNNHSGASLKLQGGSFALAANQVYLVPAWVHFSCHNRRALESFYAHFDLVGLPGAVVRQVFDRPVTLRQTIPMHCLIDTLKPRPWQNDQVTTVSWHLLMALLWLAISDALGQLSPDRAKLCRGFFKDDSAVSPALQYIEAHLNEPISNPQLAHLCHLSRDYFVRCFGQCVGQSPAQYVRERRIARAAQHLLFTDWTIDKIAAQTGFADRFHFTHVFGRIMNISPAAYRKVKRV